MNEETTERQRADEVAADLERLAAFVRANPEYADPIGYQRFLLYLNPSKDPRTAMADIARRARRAGATMRKDVSDKYAGAELRFGELNLYVYADRNQVCERVVVGTREEQVEEPDPEALAAVPKRTVTRVVEDVEWRCTPILAAEPTKQSDQQTDHQSESMEVA